jgi:fructokinase
MEAMIVVAGEALIDLIVHPDGRLTAVPGGGPFNTARTIARLGIPVAFLGRLSDDRFGRSLEAALAGDGVDLSLIETTVAPTTLAVAELDALGRATYRFHTAETAAVGLSPAAVQAALATNPGALHVGTLGLALEPIAQALVDGIASADQRILVMLDPNCRPLVISDRSAYLRRLDAVVDRADIVKASTDDLAYLNPEVPSHVAARDILDRGPAVVITTNGPDPVRCLTRTGAFELPVPASEIVDTVGAGDAFGGAFLARWTERGLGRAELADEAAVRDAVAFAIQVAVITCSRQGADPPDRTELH